MEITNIRDINKIFTKTLTGDGARQGIRFKETATEIVKFCSTIDDELKTKLIAHIEECYILLRKNCNDKGTIHSPISEHRKMFLERLQTNKYDFDFNKTSVKWNEYELKKKETFFKRECIHDTKHMHNMAISNDQIPCPEGYFPLHRTQYPLPSTPINANVFISLGTLGATTQRNNVLAVAGSTLAMAIQLR